MSVLTTSKAWLALSAHYTEVSSLPVAEMFRSDPERFRKLSLSQDGILFDYSKNQITEETLRLLLSLARQQNLEQYQDAMFTGVKINTTEDRAVLHTALRAKNKPAEVQDMLNRMQRIAEAVRAGSWTGYTGKPITDIVNIGIGGSSLGPQMVSDALASCHHPRLRAHFVSNVEASDLETTLKKLSPETTLFIIASKTFTTAETMQNANMARTWFLQDAREADIKKHFTAVSANIEAAGKFGIDPANIFPFWDWVGGRYSVWSAISLAVMLMTGADTFNEFLNGAAAMDTHFQTAPLETNMPVLMGLVGIWHCNFCHYPAYACIPYHTRLRRFPAWLQQMDMESNGKSVDRQGQPVDYPTGPMIFGEPGTNAQHSFFQWLHQSPTVIPIDFIGAVKTPYGSQKQQDMLLANMLAQGEALMQGQTNAAEPHRNFSGNRPSTTILLDELTPYTLGMLMALYEHKVFVQGIVWNINSFDQWGVELGKSLAARLQTELETRKADTHDVSTSGLLEHITKTL